MKDKIGGLKKIIRLISLIWGYFTALSLIAFGVTFLKNETTIPYAIIVFAFGLAYAILTTLLYAIGPKKNNDSKKLKKKRKLLTFIYNVVKVFIIVLPLFTLNPDLTVKFAFPTFTKFFSLVWLILTIGLEITLFLLKRTLRILSKGIQKIVSDKQK